MDQDLLPHLFRTEYSRLVAVLCRSFGLAEVELAEDIVSEAFLKAAETWGLKGVPQDPSAWLYQVARNKVRDHFRRQQRYREQVAPTWQADQSPFQEPELDFSEGHIRDSQLRMLFAVCDPAISAAGQVTLALRLLCGFGIDEIASALLEQKPTVNKRLLRAKASLRAAGLQLELPPEASLPMRLDRVLAVVYLLFNEGYHASSKALHVRKDLCLEAMRLLKLLLDHDSTATPGAHAMMALFCFHASRLDARMDAEGNPVLYDDQDRTQWDQDLIRQGEVCLQRSASGPRAGKYHFEALIAYWHTRTQVDEGHRWEQILQLYNRLLQVAYSPAAALNRTYALYRVAGAEKALEEALKIQLDGHHLYHSLLAELYRHSDVAMQRQHLERALELASHEADRRLLRQKLDALGI